MGDRERAYNFATKALEVLRLHPVSKELAECYLLMGDLHRDQFEDAREFYQAARAGIPSDQVIRGSEPYARATYALGRLWAGRNEQIMRELLAEASEQFTKLGDLELAATANWFGIRHRIRRSTNGDDKANLKTLEDLTTRRGYRLRLAAWLRDEDESERSPKGRIAARARRTAKSWQAILSLAEQELAQQVDPYE